MGKFLNFAQGVVNAAWPGAGEVKASKAGRLISLGMLGRAVWTPRRYDELAKESYVKNAVAFRAIHEIAKCAGSVPFTLFSGTGDAKKQIESHPLLSLMNRPNPLQSRAALVHSLIGYYLISGNSYLERVGPRRGPPKELWTKRPDRMKIIAGDKGMPKAYEYSVGSEKVPWPVSQTDGSSNILHVKSFHPVNDWYGMSAVEAAAFSVDQHNESGQWNMALLQNAARPSGALVLDPKSGEGLDAQQYDRLKASIEDLYTGPNNAGKPLLLEGGLDWKEMSLSPVDMDWLQGRYGAARDIAMVFGMPPMMLGIPGDNTHRNMEEARLWLWEQTIIPLMDMFLGEFNWWLAPLFGEGLTLGFNLDDVPALITRRYMLWDKLALSDFLTVNEKREAVGYAPRPEGDVIRNPSKNINLGEEEPSGEAGDGDDTDDDDDKDKTVKHLAVVNN